MIMSKCQLLKIVLLILLVIPGVTGKNFCAAAAVHPDVDSLEVRRPDSTFVSSYRSQATFKYSQPEVKNQFLQQFWTYLQKRFGSISKVISALPWILKVLLGMFILASLFIIVTQTKLYKVFYSGKEIETPEFRFSSVPDQLLDYDNEIRVQVNQKQFRIAIRLLYLKVIQQLREKDIIEYSKDKTNVDYLRDLPSPDLKSMFYRVTLIYNHVWYGETEIAEEQFLNFEKRFQSIFKTIDVQE